MKKPPEHDPSDSEDLDRTEARPGRPAGSAPAGAPDLDQTLRRPGDAPASPAAPDDLDLTLPRTPRRPTTGPKPPAAGEPTLRRPPGGTAPSGPTPSSKKPAPPSKPEVERTAVRRGAGKAGAGARRDADGDPTIARRGPAPAEPSDPMIGRILGGCRIEARLGEGGMGTVYRARQLDLDREVAIKTIRSEFATDAESLKRFQREAKAVGKFRTQHVVQIYQVGNEDGIPYIVLELLPGGSLREFAERQPEGRIGAEDAIRFLRESALALADAAAKGLVHRDIKPDNLLLDERGVVKVTDFGISKVVQQDVSMTLTMGGIVGTPMYMSPEQCRGEELDFRSDMWSLGATFFFLLTGHPPAKGSSLLELIRTKNEVRNLDPAKILPAAIPGPLSEVIRRLTMLDRDARYANYEDLIADLDAIAEGRRGSRAARSLLRWAAAVVVLGGAGFAGYQARAEIADFVRTAFAGAEPQPTAPVVDSDPDAPQPPPVDLSGMQAEIDAIRAAIPDAVDLAALATLTDRSNALSRTLDGVPPTAEVADLRAEIATANEEIGARSLLLEEVEQRRGRQDEIDRIRSRVEAGEDLAGALGDLDTLIDGIPPGTSWDGIRTAAKQLRTQGRVRWYSSRLADAERLLDQPGPQAAATPASSLVADLARETSEADFGALRDRAQKLESDVQAGLEFERRLPSRPNASWPFAEVAEWTRGVRSAADATSKEAHTEILGRWVEASARSRLADPSLTAGCRAELERAWQECTTAREQNDARRAAELNRELTAAIENLAELGTLDPAEVVSPVARAELVAWIAQSSKTEEVIEDVRQAIRVQREVGTLNAWLGKRAAAQSVRAELRARVAAEDIAEADDLTQVLAELDAGIAYWTTVTERVDSALQSTTKADLDGAARILELRDLAAGDRDPAAIPEVAAIVEAVRDLRQGFDRALTGLDPVAAAQSFQRAETAFARLPEGLAGAAGAAGYARRCAERAGTLGEAARNMAAVPAGRVEIAVGQAGIDGTYDVAAFYLDRHEVDRATFKRALDGAGLRSISADELRELQGRDWDSRPDFPALGISRAAAADCLRLSGRTLPTHAEWWLAAKGPGANTAFPWGGTWSDGGLEVRAEPLEVRSDRRPLAVGGTEVHFLVGNAAEWVGDLLANGTRGAVAGGGIDYSLGALRDAALGKVRVVAPSGRIDRSVGARGVIRPADHFGDLAPVRR